MDWNEKDEKLKVNTDRESLTMFLEWFSNSCDKIGRNRTMCVLNSGYIFLCMNLDAELRKVVVNRMQLSIKQLGSTQFEDIEDMKSFVEDQICKGK